jgi:2-dehydro-3-deoxyphosphogluconate aldolase / (4S)-4-hydroxy-2-oxoglutarate aldolase
MVTTSELRERLAAERLVAIVRGTDPDACAAAVGVLADEGISLIEVSLTSTDALSVLSRVVAAHPRLLIGAGTVLTASQARAVFNAGVSYVVTPAQGPGVDAAASLGLPVLAGCVTPTEVLAAHQAGHLVKLFPAGPLGLAYFKALRDPFPDIPLIPVGGVDADLARDYLAAGALAVGVGSPLLGGSLDGLAARARSFRSAVSS